MVQRDIPEDSSATPLLKGKATPIEAWKTPEGTRKFLDNWHMNTVRLSDLHTGHLYPPGNVVGTHYC